MAPLWTFEVSRLRRMSTMHAIAMLHRHLHRACPEMHARRLESLIAATAALSQQPRLSISAIGRALPGPAQPKHGIKRVDRLVGNPHLMAERERIYAALAHWLLVGMGEPLLVVDWSDISPDRRWQLLRAALPVGGRTLTLYEEVHPQKDLGNPHVQRRFLDRLKALLPGAVRPIVLTDAGFRVPWFKAVEAMGWRWIGRVRGRDMIRWPDETRWWHARTLYALALPRAKSLGAVDLVRSNPLRCQLYLIGAPQRGRSKRTVYGARARSQHSEKNARREREPWLLAASTALAERSAKDIVGCYRKRMQIEEGFRDLKSLRHGLGFGVTQTRQRERIANLLLLATLGLLLLWLAGSLVRRQRRAGAYQSNSGRLSLSTVSLGRYALQHDPPPRATDAVQVLKQLQEQVQP